MNNHCPKCVQLFTGWVCDDEDCPAGNYKPVETPESEPSLGLTSEQIAQAAKLLSKAPHQGDFYLIPDPHSWYEEMLKKYGNSKIRIPKGRTTPSNVDVREDEKLLQAWQTHVTVAPQVKAHIEVQLLPWKERVADLEASLITMAQILQSLTRELRDWSCYETATKLRKQLEEALPPK